MTVFRLRVPLTDPAMGSGVATHFFSAWTATEQTAAADFWDAMKQHMAGQVHIVVPTLADELDETTGELVGTSEAGAERLFDGAGAGAYAGGVGACITWDTAGVVAGHRVRGRTFIVPCANNSYDADGTLSSTVVADLSAAAAGFIIDAADSLVVWSRPRAGLAGSIHPVVARRVRDRVSWLQSRKR